MRRWRYIIPAGAILLLLGIVSWPSGDPGPLDLSLDKVPGLPAPELKGKTGQEERGAGPPPTKRSVRDMGRKPTEEETITLLRTTVVSQFEVEDATFGETVAELNQLARDRGIPARELTFSTDHRFSQHRIKELRVKNVPLAVVLKYVCGNSKIRYRVSAGRVMFEYLEDFTEEPKPTAKEQTDPDHDPFAEPGERILGKKKATDPDDPFAEPPLNDHPDRRD